MLNLWLVYEFVRRLATPFKDWQAYKLGIIDEKGNVLRSRKELLLVKERQAFGAYDVMILNLKKLLEKVPGGQSRFASYAAALFLLREWNHFTPDSMLTESITDRQIHNSIKLFFVDKSIIPLIEQRVNQKDADLNNLFEEAFSEDAPTVNVGSGAVAGLGVGPDGEPGLSKSQQRQHKKRNKPQNLRSVLGEKFLVIDNDTGKIIDTFKMKWAAMGHHHVQKGWARVEEKK